MTTIKIIDCGTGVEIERDMNEEELEQLEKDAQEFFEQKEAKNAKAAARESALAKLADLGLTAEEIAAL
jgi:hypothetical protein